MVRRSDDFVAKAREVFPPGGDAEGRPSFELFEERPLRAVQEKLSIDFEGCPESEPGSPIRVVATAHVPFFPAMIFYAIAVTDGTVEIIDFTVDDEYFDLINRDPDD